VQGPQYTELQGVSSPGSRPTLSRHYHRLVTPACDSQGVVGLLQELKW
jgi:hypothetical protein